MKNKSVILFDIDGTLVDSIGVILSCLKDTFKELSRDYPDENKLKSLIGCDLHDIFRTFFDESEAIHAVQVFRGIYIKHQNKGIVLVPKAFEIIKKLKKADKQLGAVTMKLSRFARPLFEDLNIDKDFGIIIGAEDVSFGKPHPEGLEKAMDFFQASKEECVFIGDSLHDAEAARGAKMDFLAVLTGGASEKDFKNIAVKNIFPSVHEAGEFLLSKKQ